MRSRNYHWYDMIREGQIPSKYKEVGIYMQMVFKEYDFYENIVDDTYSILMHMYENGFDFSLFQGLLIYFRYNDYCKDCVLTLIKIDRIYVSHNHDIFIDEFKKIEGKPEFVKLNNITHKYILGDELHQLLECFYKGRGIIHTGISNPNYWRERKFLEEILYVLISIAWIDKTINSEDITDIIREISNDDKFIEKWALAGVTYENINTYKIHYIAKSLADEKASEKTDHKEIL